MWFLCLSFLSVLHLQPQDEVSKLVCLNSTLTLQFCSTFDICVTRSHVEKVVRKSFSKRMKTFVLEPAHHQAIMELLNPVGALSSNLTEVMIPKDINAPSSSLSPVSCSSSYSSGSSGLLLKVEDPSNDRHVSQECSTDGAFLLENTSVSHNAYPQSCQHHHVNYQTSSPSSDPSSPSSSASSPSSSSSLDLLQLQQHLETQCTSYYFTESYEDLLISSTESTFQAPLLVSPANSSSSEHMNNTANIVGNNLHSTFNNNNNMSMSFMISGNGSSGGSCSEAESLVGDENAFRSHGLTNSSSRSFESSVIQNFVSSEQQDLG